jgi:hypothetical protein
VAPLGGSVPPKGELIPIALGDGEPNRDPVGGAVGPVARVLLAFAKRDCGPAANGVAANIDGAPVPPLGNSDPDPAAAAGDAP